MTNGGDWGSSSSSWVVTIVGGLIVTIVGGLIVYGITHHAHAKAATAGSATPTAGAAASSSPAPSAPRKSPAPSAPRNPFTPGSDHLPSQLTGTWTGSVFQASTSATYPVTLKLAQAPGTMVGTSSYPTLSCEGILRLNQVTFDTVVVTEYITLGAAGTASATGNGCVTPIQIRLKYLNKNHLLYTFANPGYPSDGQAALKRS
jgi:hypothetical protein